MHLCCRDFFVGIQRGRITAGPMCGKPDWAFVGLFRESPAVGRPQKSPIRAPKGKAAVDPTWENQCRAHCGIKLGLLCPQQTTSSHGEPAWACLLGNHRQDHFRNLCCKGFQVQMRPLIGPYHVVRCASLGLKYTMLFIKCTQTCHNCHMYPVFLFWHLGRTNLRGKKSDTYVICNISLKARRYSVEQCSFVCVSRHQFLTSV